MGVSCQVVKAGEPDGGIITPVDEVEVVFEKGETLVDRAIAFGGELVGLADEPGVGRVKFEGAPIEVGGLFAMGTMVPVGDAEIAVDLRDGGSCGDSFFPHLDRIGVPVFVEVVVSQRVAGCGLGRGRGFQPRSQINLLGAHPFPVTETRLLRIAFQIIQLVKIVFIIPDDMVVTFTLPEVAVAFEDFVSLLCRKGFDAGEDVGE